MADQWPVQGRGEHSGQYRVAPPAFLMARSRVRVPGQVRARVKPIPACLITATSRAASASPRWWRLSRPIRSYGPPDVVAGVPVGPVEVEHVDDAQLPGHGLVLQSTTQATGQAVPHALQVRAISVMPSPVSTSDSVMSLAPQSGQRCSWKMTRKPFTAHPRQGCECG